MCEKQRGAGPGDEILAVNGNLLFGMPHLDAKQTLTAVGNLVTLLVQKSTFGTRSGYTPSHMLAFELHQQDVGFGVFVSVKRKNGRTQVVIRDLDANCDPSSRQLCVGDEIVVLGGRPLANMTQQVALEAFKSAPLDTPVVAIVRRFGTSQRREISATLNRPITLQDGFGFAMQTCGSTHGPEEKLITAVEPNGHADGHLQVQSPLHSCLCTVFLNSFCFLVLGFG